MALFLNSSLAYKGFQFEPLDASMKLLAYQGASIRLREQSGTIPDMLNLTDMWKASGSDDAKRPADWKRKAGADFIAAFSDTIDVPSEHIWDANRIARDGTWSHWQIGFAYAKYLSPEFHMWCNEVVRKEIERKSSIPSIIAGGLEGDITHTRLIVDSIHDNVIELRRDVAESLLRKRKKVQPHVRALHVAEVYRCGGRCPLCSEVRIIDEHGSEIPGAAECDHAFANDRADKEHTWLICKSCHESVTPWRRSVTIQNRVKVAKFFEVYQERMRAALREKPAKGQQFKLEF